ncbi:putative diphthamide biosynthesis protein 1 [Blattamonas nauphoetae]|uniref:2-(3-amino-3-carboxypropyl)histidine synthase subunit 1 n=1 Tax=Blattamonas nauphoetae TaxID=2049346 RepID=A0ABQ9YJ28_9EUKA|nr:putative diphthamide biosynthesis protein 1 [Blattamonas nauphoetae]
MIRPPPELSLPFDLDYIAVVPFIKQFSIVCLQFPEGLLQHSTFIARYLSEVTNVECIVLGDVAYGSCNIADIYAHSLGAEGLVHYGHNPLVSKTVIPTLYIPCKYKDDQETVNMEAFSRLVQTKFSPADRIAILTTAQHSSALKALLPQLSEQSMYPRLFMPPNHPLPDGEFLGCTCPCLSGETDPVTAIVCYVDGRFQTDSAIIANPTIPVFRFDPQFHQLTHETIDLPKYARFRRSLVGKSRKQKRIGIVFSTLGRQGHSETFRSLVTVVRRWCKIHPDCSFVEAALDEITSDGLNAVSADRPTVWIIVGCPRLGLDWGTSLNSNFFVITPHEALLAFNDDSLDIPDDLIQHDDLNGDIVDFSHSFDSLNAESSEPIPQPLIPFIPAINNWNCGGCGNPRVQRDNGSCKVTFCFQDGDRSVDIEEICH